MHIERHARKRYEKAFKATPTVRVIALRKSAPTVREETAETADPNDKTKRHLKVRFVVEGHPRLQRVGPGLKETKLIFIESYPKGPEDAPFKESGPRVFAVIRMGPYEWSIVRRWSDGGDLYLHQQTQCPKRKRLYPRASPLSRALREMRKARNCPPCKCPYWRMLPVTVEDLEDRLRELSNTVGQ